jgi:uncharacterized protein
VEGYDSEKIEFVLDKYFSNNPTLRDLYLVHVGYVARKSVEIAARLNLSQDRIKFLYEAALLHDIGIVNTYCPMIHCYGSQRYPQHTIEGYRILVEEGLVEHAGVALRHNVPLDQIYKFGDDILVPGDNPSNLEERIVAYSDLFFSKLPKDVHKERKIEEVLIRTSKYGPNTPTIIMNWAVEFGELSLSDFEY